MDRISERRLNTVAYCYVEATDGTPEIIKSKNVSSITDGGVGIFTVNFASALPTDDYSWAGSAFNYLGNEGIFCIYESTTRSSSALPVRVSNSSAAPSDTNFSVIVTGA